MAEHKVTNYKKKKTIETFLLLLEGNNLEVTCLASFSVFRRRRNTILLFPKACLLRFFYKN